MPEAPLEQTDTGLVPAGDGWFVVNVRDVQWFDGGELGGLYATFEGENARFDGLGFGIGILRPGEANALYHGEDAQEDFLVLAGECLLLVEGEERLLRAWDFVHCPPWTEHIFVGAGDGPCLVLGVGVRRKGRGLKFPVSKVALAHGAGVATETTDSREAYAGYGESAGIRCPPEFPPG
ncbi:MAG: cupin domain-containing protein [Actinobacteria bacterium]|nr:cupin domain-containing protein [Actinomycetota bacterium]